MNLPLYFALDEKSGEKTEPMNDPAARYFKPDASLKGTDILIITDRPQKAPADQTATAICESCRKWSIRGVFFDFEQPLSGVFVRIAELVIRSLPDCFFLLPENYSAVSETALILCTPCLPQNCWESFCKQKQKAYPNRWALELIPYQLLYESGKKAAVSYRTVQQLLSGGGQLLPQAVCMSQRSKCRHLIYDTGKTLRHKLNIAEENGCKLSIGLWSELRYYF